MRVVFLGDSLTEGREGVAYLDVARERLAAARVRDARVGEIEVIGAGVGGDTVVNLARRLEQDVVPSRPDWVVIQTGVNDCATVIVRRSFPTRGTINGYRYFTRHKGVRQAITPPRFAEGLRVLVDAIRARTGARVAICTPALIGESRRRLAWRLLDACAEAARFVAAERGCDLIDVRAALTGEVETLPPRPLAALPLEFWRRHRPAPQGMDVETLARLRGYTLVYDGSHLTRRGAEVMAEPVVAWLLGLAERAE